jgi:hypothetical protein
MILISQKVVYSNQIIVITAVFKKSLDLVDGVRPGQCKLRHRRGPVMGRCCAMRSESPSCTLASDNLMLICSTTVPHLKITVTDEDDSSQYTEGGVVHDVPSM